MRPRKPGQPHKGWKSSAKKTLSDDAIYVAVRSRAGRDLTEEEQRELDLAIDRVLGLVGGAR